MTSDMSAGDNLRVPAPGPPGSGAAPPGETELEQQVREALAEFTDSCGALNSALNHGCSTFEALPRFDAARRALHGSAPTWLAALLASVQRLRQERDALKERLEAEH